MSIPLVSAMLAESAVADERRASQRGPRFAYLDGLIAAGWGEATPREIARAKRLNGGVLPPGPDLEKRVNPPRAVYPRDANGKRRIPPEVAAEAKRLRETGMFYHDIARALRIPRTTALYLILGDPRKKKAA